MFALAARLPLGHETVGSLVFDEGDEWPGPSASPCRPTSLARGRAVDGLGLPAPSLVARPAPLRVAARARGEAVRSFGADG